jgi:hypothetical protein
VKLGGWFGLVVLVAGTAAVTIGGCGGQGEGQRCSTNATVQGQNSDCASGLKCYSAAELGIASGIDICCPEDRAQRSNTYICTPKTGGAGTIDGGAPDASDDAGSDDAGGDGDAADDADAT